MRFYRYSLFFCVGVLTIMCIFLVVKLSSRPEPQEKIVQAVKPEPMVTILVANRQLYAGEVLQSADISSSKIPQAFVLPGTVADSSSARQGIVGTLLRVSIPKSSPIRAEDVVHPGDGGFLAALLNPGKRGIAVPVDPSNAAGGLIWPGDFVDVLLMPNISRSDEGSAQHDSAVKTLLHNVRVVAVDQHLVRGKGPAAANQNAKTVVLELLPDEAQKLALAEKIGKIVLTLRSLSQVSADHLPSDALWNDDIFEAQVKEKKVNPPQDTNQKTMIRVFNGLTEVSSNAHEHN
ncbi:Flp pilus assembly protein CpaB [Acetobacter conturbans]|uniref:Flp pilus assembly protein CpaB n=1 Tax=Acetobacter conturbans TaxID=1737472 RepID=A0ABX0K218_9PROT|nr:Flp pilus assembly protein CpaB [Acetobacter conturbans]NHN89696.1 Flp pilus assembly protein CpaB [Acetobacter conturbans]